MATEVSRATTDVCSTSSEGPGASPSSSLVTLHSPDHSRVFFPHERLRRHNALLTKMFNYLISKAFGYVPRRSQNI